VENEKDINPTILATLFNGEKLLLRLQQLFALFKQQYTKQTSIRK